MINIDLDKCKCETYPFKHIIIDNFLNEKILDGLLEKVNDLDNNNSQNKFISQKSKKEYNKFAFTKNFDPIIRDIFIELNSKKFISKLEKLMGIENLICNNVELKGAGIHRIENGGFLENHTDFNSYIYKNTKIDRRINLLIYLNKGWKKEYNGDLWICDASTKKCIKKIEPILNRCVIFNTTNKSIHGHPVPLDLPSNMRRQSIAVYYYTKSKGDLDFEGDSIHSTIWHLNIEDL